MHHRLQVAHVPHLHRRVGCRASETASRMASKLDRVSSVTLSRAKVTHDMALPGSCAFSFCSEGRNCKTSSFDRWATNDTPRGCLATRRATRHPEMTELHGIHACIFSKQCIRPQPWMRPCSTRTQSRQHAGLQHAVNGTMRFRQWQTASRARLDAVHRLEAVVDVPQAHSAAPIGQPQPRKANQACRRSR